jgi:Winged helix DNA-binding domain
MLLERSSRTAAETMSHLVGMQAQNPHDPYYALWARLDGFDPNELSQMIEQRRALRGALMRATLHLATTEDFLFLRSLLQPTLAAVLGSTAFAKDTAHVDKDALLTYGRDLLEREPMTRAQLGPLLEQRWPDAPAASLAQVVTYLLPVIQIPPRGLWGRSGPAAWATLEDWAGMPVPGDADPRQIVFRYLGAFGPASISDIRVWSRLNGLRDVVDGMRSELSVHTDEDGTEVLDVPDGVILGEDIPAPPRFLPEYDNVLLGHADRSRFFVDGIIPPGWAGNLLVDGLFSGWWKIHKGREAHLEVRLLRKVGRVEIKAVRAEADRLVELAHPEAIGRSIDLQEDH